MIRKILISPFIIFMSLGIGFFLVYDQFTISKEEIIISQQTIEALLLQNQELNPKPLTESEKEELIQGFVDDEILIREARKSGIDQSDNRVRKRMLQVMRSSLSETIPDPSYTQLQTFYEETIDRYKTDSSRSFIHVFFNFTNNNIPPLNEETITILNSTNNPGALGDMFTSGNRFPEYSFRETSRVFGNEFSKAVFAAKLNQWYGPLESRFGNHFLYVFETHDPKTAKFEDVKEYIRQDYVFQKMRDNQQEKIDEMKKNYNIVIEN